MTMPIRAAGGAVPPREVILQADPQIGRTADEPPLPEA
jgi:hypothetical protein